jgi:hypothetical protein
VGIAQVGTGQVGTGQVGIAQVGTGQVSIAQVGPLAALLMLQPLSMLGENLGQVFMGFLRVGFPKRPVAKAPQ